MNRENKFQLETLSLFDFEKEGQVQNVAEADGCPNTSTLTTTTTVSTGCLVG